jgi:NCAIR mutase (PurE)-related protein
MKGKKNSVNSNESRSVNGWLSDILQKVSRGELPVAQAVAELSNLPYEEMSFAKLDHHRSLRTGFPEVVFGKGKTDEQIALVASRLISHSSKLLVTQASPGAFEAVQADLKDAIYNPVARTITVNRSKNQKLQPGVTIVTGGTADIPVAEEAAVTAELMGNRVEKVFDVGVAGIHRLLDKLSLLRRSRVVVAVAGMEGALPSVLGGLLSVPVIAVPTSTGYGPISTDWPAVDHA